MGNKGNVEGDQSLADESMMTQPPSPRGPPQGQSHLLSWLTSSALSDTVSSCMADVTDCALRIKDKGRHISFRQYSLKKMLLDCCIALVYGNLHSK